ncbi:MAG: DUF6677 family protein [Isosphaeraceae bacterium]|nr:DUF6677 family protein [Isosphaeraceae bacterium]
MNQRTSVDLRNRSIAAFLSFLVPGLGQIYQGRTAKGVIFFVSVATLFVLGMALGDWSIVYWRWVNPLKSLEKFYGWYLLQLPAGLLALPGLIQATLAEYGMDPILWGWQAEPSQDQINSLYPRLGKLVEMGTIYTEIAGMLNVLVIFDAWDGPAYTSDTGRAAASVAATAPQAVEASPTNSAAVSAEPIANPGV